MKEQVYYIAEVEQLLRTAITRTKKQPNLSTQDVIKSTLKDWHESSIQREIDSALANITAEHNPPMKIMDPRNQVLKTATLYSHV